jgi:hypothetical protein
MPVKKTNIDIRITSKVYKVNLVGLENKSDGTADKPATINKPIP